MEMVPVYDFQCELLISGQGIQSDNLEDNRVPGKLGDVLKILLEHCHTSKRNPHEVLEDIRDALSQNHGSNTREVSLSGMTDKPLSYKNTKTPTGYFIRVFQWKAAELTAILREFVQTCNDLLNGIADLQQLVQLVASSFEWFMNHCFSIQDVSSIKYAILDHLDLDESRSESEIDNGSVNNLTESNRLHTKREEMPFHHMVYPLSRQNSSRQTEALEQNKNEECERLNIELANKESSLVGLEGMPQSDTVNFTIELQEHKVIIERLRSEMETVGQS